MLLVADNLHALNPIVSEALRDLNPKPLQELALRCEQAGAKLIDLNPGYLPRQKEDRIVFMVEAIQAVTSTRLMLDSPNPRILAKGLAACQQQPVLDGLSLEPHKLQEVLPLAVEHQVPLVLLLMDEHSYTPPRMEQKLAIAIELREYALAAGLKHEQLLFDPVLPNLSWQDAYAQTAEVVKTVQMLSSGAIFQEPALTMVGLSNLRSGLHRYYPANLETTCLSILAGAGLNFALANVLAAEIVTTAQLISQLCPVQDSLR